MKIQWKQEGKNMALLLVGALIYGIGTHAFVEPAHIAPGGAMGIALMVNHFADLPIGLLTLAINIPLLVLAWFLSEPIVLRYLQPLLPRSAPLYWTLWWHPSAQCIQATEFCAAFMEAFSPAWAWG